MPSRPRALAHRLTRSVIALMLAVLATAGIGAATMAPAQAAIIPGRCTYTGSQPTLSYAPSTYKVAVKQLQCELNDSLLYTKVTVDGYFGPATRNAVGTFQTCTGIQVDGIVGPQTWAELNYWAKSNSWVYC
ncbi:peptidoglycan-binding domain-containing protein [Actinopolymorpha pittospori]